MKSASGDRLSSSNAVSRELQNRVYQARLRRPSIQMRARWHQEWLDSGAQFQQSYHSFARKKTREYWQQLKSKKRNQSKTSKRA